MECLAAVGLAGNIVSFIDFSCKLFSQATAIHHSTSGASQDTQDLENVAQTLQNHCVALSSVNHNVSSHDQPALRKLAKECKATATELLSALQSVKAKNPNSKWSSFRAALAKSWKEPRIGAMVKNLDSYREQMMFQLQVMQR
jgi:hypothetical protein